MNLTFTESTDQSFGGSPAYEATFNASNAFNLHIERDQSAALIIYQRTPTAGRYARLQGLDYSQSQGEVIDLDFKDGIFPKDIKVVSASKPSMAFVTFAE